MIGGVSDLARQVRGAVSDTGSSSTAAVDGRPPRSRLAPRTAPSSRSSRSIISTSRLIRRRYAFRERRIVHHDLVGSSSGGNVGRHLHGDAEAGAHVDHYRVRVHEKGGHDVGCVLASGCIDELLVLREERLRLVTGVGDPHGDDDVHGPCPGLADPIRVSTLSTTKSNLPSLTCVPIGTDSAEVAPEPESSSRICQLSDGCATEVAVFGDRNEESDQPQVEVRDLRCRISHECTVVPGRRGLVLLRRQDA
jgi:hypothetical protein